MTIIIFIGLMYIGFQLGSGLNRIANEIHKMANKVPCFEDFECDACDGEQEINQEC